LQRHGARAGEGGARGRGEGAFDAVSCSRPDALRALIHADSQTFARIIKDVGIPMEG